MPRSRNARNNNAAESTGTVVILVVLELGAKYGHGKFHMRLHKLTGPTLREKLTGSPKHKPMFFKSEYSLD